MPDGGARCPFRSARVDAADLARLTRGVVGGAGSQRHRIVLGDDAPDVLAALTLVVESIPGAVVVGTALDAPRTVEVALATSPHLVVLDINMPGHGLEACRRLSPIVPVVVHSAVPADRGRRWAIAAGAADFIAKGVPVEELRAGIARHLPA